MIREFDEVHKTKNFATNEIKPKTDENFNKTNQNIEKNRTFTSEIKRLRRSRI